MSNDALTQQITAELEYAKTVRARAVAKFPFLDAPDSKAGFTPLDRPARSGASSSSSEQPT